MNKKKMHFMIIPLDIDADPRLQWWLSLKGVNDREVIWAVERMIARLAQRQDKPYRLQDLLEGLHRRHLSYPVLKEIVITSGFFEYEDGYVWYNWERFSQSPARAPRKNSAVGHENEQLFLCSQSAPEVRSECSPTPACDLKATNVDKDIDADIDNYGESKKENKEKKESVSVLREAHEARIHKIMTEYPFHKSELSGWGGDEDDLEERRQLVEQHMLCQLREPHSQLAETVCSNLGIKDYDNQWKDIWVEMVTQLAATGSLSKLVKPGKVFTFCNLLSSQTNEKEHLYQAGLHILKRMEERHQAWIKEEKKRFPFEDYDPERGTRYVGNEPIPWDAPPRPDNSSRWDYEECRWVSLAEQEAAIAHNSESRRNAIAEFCRRKREREAVREL